MLIILGILLIALAAGPVWPSFLVVYQVPALLLGAFCFALGVDLWRIERASKRAASDLRELADRFVPVNPPQPD